jgi:signal transduction histidine kinase/CheY-like chemotaxis protein
LDKEPLDLSIEDARARPADLSTLAIAYDALPAGVFVFNPDLYLILANRIARACLPTARAGAVPRLHWTAIWPDADAAALQVAFEAALRGEPTDEPIICPGSEADTRCWELRMDRLYDERGEIRILCLAHDVTHSQRRESAVRSDLRQSEASSLALAAQLSTKMAHMATMQDRLTHLERIRVLGTFAGAIVHDINNVLAVFASILGVAARKSGAWNQEMIVTGEAAVAQGATLARRLMDFIRHKAPDISLISVPEVLAGNAPLLARLLGDRIRLISAAAEDVWPLIVRNGAIEGVLFNLAANARDAMPKGGVLRIEASNCPPGQHPARLPAGEYVRIEITDTGGGMNEEVLAKAGQPFFTTKRQGEGTGLGLASAFDLAENAGGCVTLDSRFGQGTTVSLFLPRAGVRGQMARYGGEVANPLLHGGAAVLLVESDDAVRGALAGTLHELGYSVTDAASAEAALGLAAAALDVELLIVDIATVVQTSTDLVGRLRRDRPRLPVLYLRGPSESRPLAGEIVLRKPIFEPLLARAVLVQLGRLPGAKLPAATLAAGEAMRARIVVPAMRDLFERWHALARALERLPALDDFISADGSGLSAHGFICQVVWNGKTCCFTVVRMGAALAARLSHDRLGVTVWSHDDDMLGSLQQACRRCAHFDYARVRLDNTTLLLFERLVLPLSDDGESVTHMLGEVMFEERQVA